MKIRLPAAERCSWREMASPLRLRTRRRRPYIACRRANLSLASELEVKKGTVSIDEQHSGEEHRRRRESPVSHRLPRKQRRKPGPGIARDVGQDWRKSGRHRI